MPSFPALAEPLGDGVLELRAASEWDIPDILIAHQDDPHLYRLLGLDRPPSGAELGRRAEREPAEWAAGTGARLTIVEPGGRTCRGQLEVHHVDWTGRETELGIWLAPQVRGRGWAPRVLRLGAAWLFDACGLARLRVRTGGENRAMIATARAAGFSGAGQRPGPVSLTLVRPPLAPPTA